MPNTSVDLLALLLGMVQDLEQLRSTAAYYQLDAIRSLEHRINEGLRAIRDEARNAERAGLDPRND
jgi:hypothetical protein